MGTWTRWRTCLLALAGAFFLLPAKVGAQDRNVGDPYPVIPLPLMWGDKDEGVYFFTEAMFYRLNNPINSQILAVRGFFDEAGLISGTGAARRVFLEDPPTEFLTRLRPFQGTPGQFIGSKTAALDAAAVGNDSFEGGFKIGLGYRFRNDISIEVSYNSFAQYHHTAGAGPLPPTAVGFPPGGGVGADLADSYLTVPFFNVPPIFAGPSRDVVSNVLLFPLLRGGPGGGPVFVSLAPSTINEVSVTQQQLDDLRTFGGFPIIAYGIFNAAEDIQLDFIQEFWNFEINGRFPVNQTECTRTTMTVGWRMMELFERFRMRVVDQDADGNTSPLDTAIYNNEWENRFYGVTTGLQHEYYLGGGFAVSVDGRCGIFGNVQHTKVLLELGADYANTPGITKQERDFSFSPMFSGAAYVWWYPIEGVQIRAGYEFLGVFNVRRTSDPVSFDLGNFDPTYSGQFMRMDGASLGFALIF